MVDSRLSIDLDMFSRGGLAVLDDIEASGYDKLPSALPSAKASKIGCSAAPWLIIFVARDPKPAAGNQEEIADYWRKFEGPSHRAIVTHSNSIRLFLLPRKTS